MRSKKLKFSRTAFYSLPQPENISSFLHDFLDVRVQSSEREKGNSITSRGTFVSLDFVNEAIWISYWLPHVLIDEPGHVSIINQKHLRAWMHEQCLPLAFINPSTWWSYALIGNRNFLSTKSQKNNELDWTVECIVHDSCSNITVSALNVCSPSRYFRKIFSDLNETSNFTNIIWERIVQGSVQWTIFIVKATVFIQNRLFLMRSSPILAIACSCSCFIMMNCENVQKYTKCFIKSILKAVTRKVPFEHQLASKI